MPKQNRELKNRVREIRSHGSVRGMGCESHLYSEAEVEAYSLKNIEVASRLTMIDRLHRISSGNRSIHPVNPVYPC